MKKAELINAFKENGITQFNAIRRFVDDEKNETIEHKSFVESDWVGQPGDRFGNAPLVDEMRTHLSGYYKLVRSTTRQIVEDQEGGIVIFTPQMVPDLQPIEMLW